MVFTAIRTINDLSGPRKGGPFHTYFGSRSERSSGARALTAGNEKSEKMGRKERERARHV